VAEATLGVLSRGEIESLAPGEMLARAYGDRKVLVCNVAGRLFAVENRCSHAAVELSRGTLEGFEVECPFHGARFDVRSGAALCAPAQKPIAAFDVVPNSDGAEVRTR